MWAEMLCFADRQFYLDWWNSTSINAYYRTWNTLVQDWLYTYIYQDLYKVRLNVKIKAYNSNQNWFRILLYRTETLKIQKKHDYFIST